MSYKIFIFLFFIYLQPSTTENVAIFIWDNLRSVMKRPELLYEVRIEETDKNSVIYRGPYSIQNRKMNDNNHCQRIQCTNISSDSD